MGVVGELVQKVFYEDIASTEIIIQGVFKSKFKIYTPEAKRIGR